MSKVLIDTDILSEYLKGIDQAVVQRGDAYAQEHAQFTFSSVTVYEIIRGLEEKGAANQVQKALRWLKTNEEILPSAEDYLTAARIKAQARRLGNVVELPDCLIAAAASRLGVPLVTGNTGDFAAIQKTGLALVLENWRNTQSRSTTRAWSIACAIVSWLLLWLQQHFNVIASFARTSH